MNLKAIHKLREAGDHEKAGELAIVALTSSPGDPELQFEAACIHDYLGREAEAIPLYCLCIAAGLSPVRLRQAYLGLGSTYRVLGQYEKSERVLREGLEKFPQARELEVFLAMTLYNLGKAKESAELLLRIAARTSNDKAIRKHKSTILFYSKDLDKIWGSLSDAE